VRKNQFGVARREIRVEKAVNQQHRNLAGGDGGGGIVLLQVNGVAKPHVEKTEIDDRLEYRPAEQGANIRASAEPLADAIVGCLAKARERRFGDDGAESAFGS